MYYVNKNIEKLERIFDQNSRENYLRLDLNENPIGFDQTFIDEVLKGVTPEIVSKYPETLEFTEKLGKFIGANVDEICLTNGSAEAIRYVIEAFTKPGGRVVSVSPSYAMYEVYSKMYGRNHIGVEYNDDLTFDINKILKEITPDTDLVVILNPNNPVGDTYSYEDMDKIIAKAKECEVTVLIDEAYYYFYPNSFIKYALENDFVFLTRTFSKLFSLAGCRLGYVVGKPEGIKLIQKLCTPHNVNAFGIRFAQKIIETDGMVEGLIEKQLEGKRYLINELINNGYTINAKEGNFLFIKPKTDATKIVERMKEEKKILVKVYKGVGSFGECLRVSTGEKEAMKKFLDALLELDK